MRTNPISPVSSINSYRIFRRRKTELSETCRNNWHVPSGKILIPRNIMGIVVVYDRCTKCGREYERKPTSEENKKYEKMRDELFGNNSANIDTLV